MGTTAGHPLLVDDAAFDAVHADTLRFFPELVRELGGEPEKLLFEGGFDPGCLSSGRPAGYRLIANLMEHAAARLCCPDFGMRLASAQGGGSVFGALGLVMRHASTLAEGLAYVVNHGHAHSLAARVRLEPELGRRRVLVSHDILLDRLPMKRQAIEQFLLLAHLNALEISGEKARVREVRFRFQPLSPVRTYQRYFGCEVRFDEAVDGVVFGQADLQCPTIAPDPQLYARATAFVDSQYALVKPPLRAAVRAVILQLLETTDCNKDRAAAELHLHPRTLHRRLTAEGTCFEKLKDGVRRDVALGYLHATQLSLQRIAEKVGYAEHSVLTRSCSRWFAASPRQIRRHAGALQVVPNCRVEPSREGEAGGDRHSTREATET